MGSARLYRAMGGAASLCILTVFAGVFVLGEPLLEGYGTVSGGCDADNVSDVQVGIPLTRDGSNHPVELMTNPEGPLVALLKPNMTLWITRGKQGRRVTPYRVSTNNEGLRDEEIRMPKPQNQTRVLVLGDSNVFGWRINTSDRFTDRLEVLLNNRSNTSFRVINAGIPGAQLEDYYLFLRERGIRYEPDIVVVVFSKGDTVPLRVVKRIESQVMKENPDLSWEDRRLHHLLRKRQGEYLSNLGSDPLVSCLQKIDTLADRNEIEPMYLLMHSTPDRTVQEIEETLHKEVLKPPEELFEHPDRYRYSAEDKHFTPEWHNRVSTHLYAKILAAPQ